MITEVIYKQTIEIDGRIYNISSFDFTTFVEEAIKAEMISDDHYDIIDWVKEDIADEL